MHICMYIYTYIHTYIYVYKHIDICIYIYIYICKYMQLVMGMGADMKVEFPTSGRKARGSFYTISICSIMRI